jgi:hypothetical protein
MKTNIIDVPAEIRNGLLPNVRQKSYHLAKLVPYIGKYVLRYVEH